MENTGKTRNPAPALSVRPVSPLQRGSLRDRFVLAALGAGAYAPMVAKTAVVGGVGSLLTQAAVIGGLALLLRMPGADRIPVLIASVFTLPMLARGRRRDPEVQAMVDDLLATAGSNRKVVAEVYERGVKSNAMAIGNRILVSADLKEKLKPAELKFIVAHELSHIEMKDMGSDVWFIPPYVDSIFTGIGLALWMGGQVAQTGAVNTPLALGVSAAALTYYGGTKAVQRYHSRWREYRADANALRLTGDFNAAAQATEKISGEYYDIRKRAPLWMRLMAGHPLGRDRMEALERVRDEMRAAAPAGL